MVVVRELDGPAEFVEAERVQKEAWGMSDIMVTPKEIMIAIRDNGGLVLGAFDEGRLIGFALSFPGYRKGKLFMYSHQTGVSREYQSRGVGYLLKQKQKEMSIMKGFDLIAWTYDPIIARNAHFNLVKLGAIARTYKPNYYGPMNDSINAGWETDRVVAEWWVKDVAIEEERRGLRLIGEAHQAIQVDLAGSYARCLGYTVDLNARKVLVEIPRDIVKLKEKDPEEAVRWRLFTREVFKAYFAAGYAAVDVVYVDGRPNYVLSKLSAPQNVFA
ncbi:MAG: GNAT family N-acetyltransferase [Thermoprotei archaeon]